MVDEFITNVHIPNFSQIQTELKEYVSKLGVLNLGHKHAVWSNGEDISMSLYKYLKENYKILPNRFTFLITDPDSKVPAHIDGGGINHSQNLNWVGLNIPVQYTENSITKFYTVDEDNMNGRWPIDLNKIREIASFTFTQPYLINTGILHSVENLDKENKRIMLLIRWHPKYDFDEEVQL